MIHRGAGKPLLFGKVVFSREDVSHLPFGLPDELVTGKYPALGIYGRIFIAAAAAPQPFDGTGTLFQICLLYTSDAADE